MTRATVEALVASDLPTNGVGSITAASLRTVLDALADAAYMSDDLASQAQAAAGTDNATIVTPLRVAQALAALGLVKANNLSDLASASTARTNLGLGGAALLAVGTTAGTVAAGDDSRIVAAAGAALKSANLSDLANAGAARTNLGLGGAATLAVGTSAGTVAAGDDSRITGSAQKASNLSDLANAGTARTNLGLGGAATLAVGTSAGTVAAGDDSRITGAAQKSSNLSDLANAGTARTNLGLGTAAVANTGTGSGNVVVLNGSSQLPAVDGSLLTGITSAVAAVSARSADYSVVLADKGTHFKLTGDAKTLTLAAGATVANFFASLRNDGTGQWTITPSSGTINGRSSIVAYPGENFFFACDGTNWTTIGRAKEALLAHTAITAVAAIDFEWTDTDVKSVAFDLAGVTLGSGTLIARFKKSGSYVTGGTYKTNTSADSAASTKNATDTSIPIATAQTAGFSGRISVLGVTNTHANGCVLVSDGNYPSSGAGNTSYASSGSENTAAAVTGVRFLASDASNFTAQGAITAYVRRG